MTRSTTLLWCNWFLVPALFTSYLTWWIFLLLTALPSIMIQTWDWCSWFSPLLLRALSMWSFDIKIRSGAQCLSNLMLSLLVTMRRLWDSLVPSFILRARSHCLASSSTFCAVHFLSRFIICVDNHFWFRRWRPRFNRWKFSTGSQVFRLLVNYMNLRRWRALWWTPYIWWNLFSIDITWAIIFKKGFAV